MNLKELKRQRRIFDRAIRGKENIDASTEFLKKKNNIRITAAEKSIETAIADITTKLEGETIDLVDTLRYLYETNKDAYGRLCSIARKYDPIYYKLVEQLIAKNSKDVRIGYYFSDGKIALGEMTKSCDLIIRADGHISIKNSDRNKSWNVFVDNEDDTLKVEGWSCPYDKLMSQLKGLGAWLEECVSFLFDTIDEVTKIS